MSGWPSTSVDPPSGPRYLASKNPSSGSQSSWSLSPAELTMIGGTAVLGAAALGVGAYKACKKLSSMRGGTPTKTESHEIGKI